MSPINLFIRFLLELSALVSIGIWARSFSYGVKGWLIAFIVPIVFAVIWGVFAVRNDPSRSGKTVVQTPGIIRLIIELGIFGIAFLGLYFSGYLSLAFIFGALVLVHYLWAYKRVIWLVSGKARSDS